MNKKTVMIAVLAVAVIAIAATFAAIGNGDGGKDDYVAPKDTRLWIFGNANMDDRLDENDMKYLDRILSGEREPTQFADANNDGDVNEKIGSTLGSSSIATRLYVSTICRMTASPPLTSSEQRRHLVLSTVRTSTRHPHSVVWTS